MLTVNIIKGESVNNYLDQMRPVLDEPEMSTFDSEFLCGLIMKKRPRKIVEIGIAAGATTSMIIQCMEKCKYNYEMYSVDYSRQYYRQVDGMKSGFMAEDTIKKAQYVKHSFILGGCVWECLDQLGDDIDFLLLDTMHSLPGEILDFLVLFNHLSSDALVCLHDISLNNRVRGWSHMNATNVLFHSVVGDKFLNSVDKQEGEAIGYPNIGAFRINKDTKEYIENVFLALTMSWSYMPSFKDIEGYGYRIKEQYPRELVKIYEDAFMMNARMMYPFPERLVPKDSRVVLYGAGNVGREYARQLKTTGYCRVQQWVDQNFEAFGDVDGIQISNPEDINMKNADYVLITLLDHRAAYHIFDYLVSRGVEKKRIIWAGKEIYEY